MSRHKATIGARVEDGDKLPNLKSINLLLIALIFEVGGIVDKCEIWLAPSKAQSAPALLFGKPCLLKQEKDFSLAAGKFTFLTWLPPHTHEQFSRLV